MGDSYYEYLIKQWIQNGKRDIRYKNLWLKAMQEVMDRLIVKTKKGTMFVAEEANSVRIDKMEHLVCFVGGRGVLVFGGHRYLDMQLVLGYTLASEDVIKSGLAPNLL